MASTWPPSKEAEFADYIEAFSAAISASPTTYGFTVPEAAALASTTTSFLNAFALATNPVTRTESTVANKDITKATALAMLRAYARRIQANPAVTTQQKIDLGLPIHKTTQTPIPAPVTRPVVTLAGTPTGLVVPIRIVDETTPTKKAKPYGVEGAEVYSFVAAAGEEPPADLEQWRFEGIATRSTFNISYRPEDATKTTHIRVVWFNPRGQAGPASVPLTAKVAA